MGRVSNATRTASKKTATAIGRSTGRLVKKTVKSGLDARSKRDKRRGR